MRAVGVIVALGVVACQGASREHERPARDAAAPALVFDDVGTLAMPRLTGAPLPQARGVRLLDAGAAPRAPRRYAPTSGNRTVRVTARLSSRVLADGVWSTPVAAAPMIQAVALDAEPGRLRLRPLAFEPRDAGASLAAPPDAATALVAAARGRWAPLEDRRVTVTVDDRGRLDRLAFADQPGDTGGPADRVDPPRDALWDWLLGLAVPLPDEPIGAGARWEARWSLRAGTASVEQIAEYTLVDVAATGWTIDVVARRVGEPQATDPTGLPPGTRAELVGLFREVRGRVVVGPGDPLPRAGALDVELRVHGRFTRAGTTAEQASEDVGTLSID